MARIHIFGASGSGTTTLAESLSYVLGWRHYDTDDYFWEPTDPPFQKARVKDKRVELLQSKLDEDNDWILSGSLCGWGDVFIPYFDVVVFLWIPQDIRLERLRVRQETRYGELIVPGGSMEDGHNAFMKWASEYDDGDMNMRSRIRHEEWIKTLNCEVIRFEGDIEVEEKVKKVLEYLKNIGY